MILDYDNPPPPRKPSCRHRWSFYAWHRDRADGAANTRTIVQTCQRCPAARMGLWYRGRAVGGYSHYPSLDYALLGRPQGAIPHPDAPPKPATSYLRSSLERRCRHRWAPYRWLTSPGRFHEAWAHEHKVDGDVPALIEVCRKCAQARVFVKYHGTLYLASYAESIEEALLGRRVEELREDHVSVN